MLLLLTLSLKTLAQDQEGQLSKACDEALNSAKDVIVLQTGYITQLEENKKELEGALSKSIDLSIKEPEWFQKPEAALVVGFILGGIFVSKK